MDIALSNRQSIGAAFFRLIDHSVVIRDRHHWCVISVLGVYLRTSSYLSPHSCSQRPNIVTVQMRIELADKEFILRLRSHH